MGFQLRTNLLNVPRRKIAAMIDKLAGDEAAVEGFVKSHERLSFHLGLKSYTAFDQSMADSIIATV